MDYNQQIYNWLRNTLLPIMNSIDGKLTTINTAISNFQSLMEQYWQWGLILGLFAFLWFMSTKIVQPILYK